MKKIIHWHENFYPIMGGCPAHIQNLVSNMNKEYRHEIITDYVKNYPKIEDLFYNARIHRLPAMFLFRKSGFFKKRVISYPCRVLNDLQRLKAKIKHIKKERYHILHVHGVVFYNALLKLNHIASKDIYQRIVDFSSVRGRKLLTLHNFFPDFTKDKIVIDAYNHYIDQFDNIICVDKHIYDYCVQYCKKKNYKKKIWFIPNSIDTEKFFYAAPKDTQRLRIGFVGRLARTVDSNMINQLIANLPKDMKFYIVVSGDLDLVKIPKYVEDRVKAFSIVPQPEMPEYYQNIDILFNPVVHKGVTRVTLEAMSCGRPVVMYKLGDRYPVVNGKTGYLIDQNIVAIIDILKNVSRKQNLLENLGLNARLIIEKEFSNKVVLPRIRSIYEILLRDL